MDQRSVAMVLGPGGGEVGRHVRSLVAELTARGRPVDVYCPAETAIQHDFNPARVRPLDVGGGARDAAAVASLRRALRTEPVDVIHAHGLAAGVVAALARPAGLPLVVTWHTNLAAHGVRSLLHRSAARTVAAAADVTLAASADLLAVATALGARDARPALIAAPPRPAYRRTAAAVRAEFGLAATTPLVLSVGRLEPRQRQDILIAAAGRWRTLQPVPTVLIAGVGPAYRRLAAQAAVARAPVILTGQRDDVGDLLHAADVAVVTGRADGRPAFVQEALSAGTPLVAPATGMLPELVGDAAVLVAPEDVDAVDDAVRALLDDPARRTRLGAAGAHRAREWPTDAQAADQVEAIYAELAAADRDSARES